MSARPEALTPVWYIPPTPDSRPTARLTLLEEARLEVAVGLDHLYAYKDQLIGLLGTVGIHRRDTPPVRQLQLSHVKDTATAIAKKADLPPTEVVRSFKEQLSRAKESFVYVSCLHGGSDAFYNQLRRLHSHPPKYLIFTGDVSGGGEISIQLKRYFYDYILNRANPMIDATPHVTPAELLDSPGTNPPPDAPTIRDGYKAMRAYVARLEEASEDEVRDVLASLTDNEIYADILRMRSLLYSGVWIGTLPQNIRTKYLTSYRPAAERFLRETTPFREAGTKLILVNGNEDDRRSLAVVAGSDISISDVFYTPEYLKQHGFRVFEQIGGWETKTTYHVFVPYFELLDYDQIPPEKLAALIKQVKRARSQGKSIIAVIHGEPNWAVHSQQEPKGDRSKVLEHSRQFLTRFKPDTVVYGHQHQEIPARPDPSAQYMLDTDGHLITDRDDVSKAEIAVTYLPLQTVAELDIPRRRRKRNRAPRIFTN